jgi:hypothetical protein
MYDYDITTVIEMKALGSAIVVAGLARLVQFAGRSLRPDKLPKLLDCV